MNYQVNQIFDCEYITLAVDDNPNKLQSIRDWLTERFDLLSTENQDTDSRLWLSLNIGKNKTTLSLWNIKPKSFDYLTQNSINQKRGLVIEKFEQLLQETKELLDYA